MALGEANQEVTYNKSPDRAFADVHRALSMIGKVKNSDKISLTIEGTSRYGFQSVKLKVKITPQGNTSSILIRGFSDDI